MSGGGDDAGDGGERSGDDVDGQDVAGQGDAGEADGLLVGADGGDDAAEAGEAEHDAAGDEHGEHQDDGLGQAEEEAGAEIGEGSPPSPSGMGRPSEMIRERPRAMAIMARDMTKEGRRR